MEEGAERSDGAEDADRGEAPIGDGDEGLTKRIKRSEDSVESQEDEASASEAGDSEASGQVYSAFSNLLTKHFSHVNFQPKDCMLQDRIHRVLFSRFLISFIPWPEL